MAKLSLGATFKNNHCSIQIYINKRETIDTNWFSWRVRTATIYSQMCESELLPYIPRCVSQNCYHIFLDVWVRTPTIYSQMCESELPPYIPRCESQNCYRIFPDVRVRTATIYSQIWESERLPYIPRCVSQNCYHIFPDVRVRTATVYSQMWGKLVHRQYKYIVQVAMDT